MKDLEARLRDEETTDYRPLEVLHTSSLGANYHC